MDPSDRLKLLNLANFKANGFILHHAFRKFRRYLVKYINGMELSTQIKDVESNANPLKKFGEYEGNLTPMFCQFKNAFSNDYGGYLIKNIIVSDGEQFGSLTY